MKTFLALAVLSLAATVTTQAASSAFATELFRPKVGELTTGESGTTRVPQRPKADVVSSDDLGANRLPPRLNLVAIDGAGSNRLPPRLTVSETGSDRMPKLNRAGFIAAKSRPKVQNSGVTTL